MKKIKNKCYFILLLLLLSIINSSCNYYNKDLKQIQFIL